MAKNPKFNSLLREMYELHQSKNSDYCGDGPAINPYQNFIDSAATAGTDIESVFLTLIGVKLARIRALRASGKEPNNESLQDSRKDLAMYAALYASWFLPLSYDDRQLASALNGAEAITA